MPYEEWKIDIERRLVEITSHANTSKWCDFLQWQTELLLHMPCRRNPEPNEESALKCFDAAVRIAHGYWEMAERDQIDNPWHAVHHCYEAGNLILYSLWYFPGLIRQHYTTKNVFEIVHEISGFFVRSIPVPYPCYGKI